MHKYYDEWHEAARNIKMDGPMPITFSIKLTREGLQVHGHIWTIDTEGTHQRTTINSLCEIYPGEFPSVDKFIAITKMLLTHELEETFKIDGVALWEPHPERGRATVDLSKERWWNA